MKVFSRFAVIPVVLAIAGTFSVPVLAETENVFRAVGANGAGRALTNPGQFRFNPSLSTFNMANRPASPCYVVFLITNLPNNPPVVGDSGLVDGLTHGNAHYTATFNNVPVGHWDVDLPAGVTDPEGRVDVSEYARDNPEENIVNGISLNCVP